jgi:outer membrane receptor for ferrienterochelin and colicins
MPLPSLTSLAALLCCSALASSAPTKPSSALGEAASHTPWLDRLGEAEAVGQVRALQGLPVEGARIDLVVNGEHRSFTTDARGCFRMPAIKSGRYRFEVSADGFDPLRREFTVAFGKKAPNLRFLLRPIVGAVVEVEAGMQAQVKPLLQEDIVTTETIRPLDIQKLNAVSLNEAVDCKPGISVQTECSICNVRNVVLNNLPGRFTTILMDGVPIFSSVSGAYGLDMIGVNGVETIDVSRGAGVSLIAPEALAGTVNVVSRRPAKAETILETQGGEGGFKRLDAFWAMPFQGGAVTATFLGNHHDTLDGNGNRVSEYSGYKRYLGGMGLFLDNVAGFKLRGRLDLVDESRGGGAMGFDHDATRRDLRGNPFDWRGGKGGSPDARGWIRPDGDFAQAQADGQNPILLPDGRVLLPYDGGLGGFSEIIDTTRQQGILVAERDLGENRRLRLAFGSANHSQDSFYEGDLYKANQHQHYAEASLQWFFAETMVTTGLSYRYENLRSHGRLTDGTDVHGLDDYAYRTPAAFVQAYHAFFNGRLELNGSVRHDDNNVFGSITTPRLNLLWHHTPRMNSRLAVGRGFRVPTSFFEQDHGILATTRIDRVIDKAETSDNASYTFSSGGEHCSVVLSASYNRIHNYALLDSGATDPMTGAPITLFTQSKDPLTVKGLDGTLTWKLAQHLEGTLGAERYLYDFTPGTLSFARPEERAYLRLDYDREGLNLFVRGTWTGPMDLARFYDYAHTPRYNLDGTSKLKRSPAYWTVDLSATWKFAPMAALILSVNNVFDVLQTDKEDFLWVDRSGKVDVTHFWGPGRGRSIQAGLRWTF